MIEILIVLGRSEKILAFVQYLFLVAVKKKILKLSSVKTGKTLILSDKG